MFNIFRTIKRKNRSLSVFCAFFFLAVVGAAVFTAGISPLALAVYVCVSLLTFMVYAKDKSAAEKGKRRIRERTLHMLSVLGGWPGALVAQQRLRHKTGKQPFRSIFWGTVLVNCAVFIGFVAV